MARIDRALIIRREQVPLSMEYAEGCAKSCEKHGLPYEFITAVEFLPCDKAFASVGARKAPTYNNTMGNCCCHSSHIKCWRRIVEIDRPCLVLEHDALVLGDVRGIDIPDMAAVTFGHRVTTEDQYSPPRPIEKLVQINRAIGVHACALTPVTAKWLVDDVEKNPIKVGVDRWLMMQRASGLPLYVAEPPQVVCWARISTSNFERSKQFTNGRSQVINYPEALTDGWREGLKKR